MISLAVGSEPLLPPVTGGKKLTCPQLNFFNVRRQIKTDLQVDTPPTGWEVVSTQNPGAHEDLWYPTIPSGASLQVRGGDIFLRCEYKPRNWIQRWVLGSATIEKSIGPLRPGRTLCWTIEGVERRPAHRLLTKEEPIFLPCIGGLCEILCS